MVGCHALGALQETKWFRCEVYEVDGSVVLTAGRATPIQGEPVQRGKGVALMIRGLAVAAWRCGGKQWKAWSLRCVSAYLRCMKGSCVQHVPPPSVCQVVSEARYSYANRVPAGPRGRRFDVEKLPVVL